jgi:ribosomal protein L9
MSDQELKDLVASLAISQKATDEQMKELQRKIDKVASLYGNVSQNQEKTDEQMRELQRKIDKVASLYGNISQNQGDVAEEFFYNSLSQNLKLGSVKFEDIAENIHKHRGNTQEEYDIVMSNGDSIGIVEVKYKAHPSDIEKLKRKMQNYKLLFPRDKDFKLYGAIAGFYVPQDAIEKAKDEGFFVLKRSGNLIDNLNSENLRVY